MEKKRKWEFNVESMDGALYGKEEDIKAYAAQYPVPTGDFKCPMWKDGVCRCSTCMYHEANYGFKVEICTY